MNRCLSIQSHVVYGYVGNKCAVLPLQLHGFDVCPINSVQFSNHTGYKNGFNGEVLNGGQLESLVKGMEDNNLIGGFTHVLTGYMGSPSFVASTIKVVKKLREAQSDLVYVCDPVMGDNGHLYVPETLVDIYKRDVIQHATIITPNQFECELLTGITIKTEIDAMKACEYLHKKGVKIVIITSLDLEDEDNIVVICSNSDSSVTCTQFKLVSKKLPMHFTGTGDLFASLLLSWIHGKRKSDIVTAVECAFAGVQAVCNRTCSSGDGGGELKLVESIADLVEPTINVKAILL